MNLSDLWAEKARANTAVSAEDDSRALVDQIRRLGELRDQGLLSAEQFRVRRAQLLGRPA
jgi:Short C-terminal domain